MKRKLYLTACLLVITFLAVGCGNNIVDDNGVQPQNIDGTLDRGLNQPPNNGMNRDQGALDGTGRINNGNRMDNGWDNRNGMNNGNGNNNGNPMNNANNGGARDEFEIAEEAAERVTQLDFVRSAYVIKTADNAYVAALLENEGEMSRHMEDQVAEAVRSIDGSVNNVYVSTNPNFMQRVNSYIDDIGQGRPVEGFVEEFTEMIDRIFPNAT